MTSSAGARGVVERSRLPAMRLRHPHGERAERLASIVVACLVTAGSTAVLIAAPARFALTAPAVRQRVNAVPEHVVYVETRVASTAVAPAPQAAPSIPVFVSSDAITTATDSASRREPDQPSSESSPSVLTADPPAVAAPTASAPVGAPAAGLTVGFSTRRRSPIRYDSALGVVQDNLDAMAAAARREKPDITQAERDEQMRADARDAVAARGAGIPNPPGKMTAGGIAVGLPFGGPSREQRERDRRNYDEAKKILARVQRRADSVVAARRRRFADSLAQVADSQVRRARPR